MKRLVKEIARERIQLLLEAARRESDPCSEYAVGYVKLARKISSHYRIALDRRIPVCGVCNCVLVPGKNASVTVASSRGYVAYTCKKCGAEARLRYKGR
jgi:RNase P subunit RPR2